MTRFIIGYDRTVRCATVCLLLLVGLACGQGTDPAQRPTHIFAGHVVDAAGAPVAGATVVVETNPKVWHNASGTAGLIIDWRNGTTHRLITDPAGNFTIALPDEHSVLTIRNVSSGNLEMVRDWAWQATAGGLELDHTFFDFGVDRDLPEVRYVFDPDRPAIFPVHAPDDPRPVRMPSRGGTNVTRSGHMHANVPVPVLVPSVGPQAPQTADEIGAAVNAIPLEERQSHIPSRQH